MIRPASLAWFVVLVLLAIPLAHGQSAQPFPSRPLEVVVHTAPGSGTDLMARIVADILVREKLIHQPVRVLNKPGGGGAIAYTYIKGKRGDPYTVLAVGLGVMLAQTVRPELKLGLDNYTPIAFLAQDPQALMVSADSPYKTFKDFIEAARRDPKSLVGSVSSPGGAARLAIWMLERETGARFTPVHFKSGADAIMQVVGGHTHFTTENIAEGYGFVETKKLRVLAVTARTRLPIVPDAPTLIELGHNIHVGAGRGFAMPADVPKEAAARMEAILERLYRKSPAWKEFSEKNMFENIWMGSAEFAKYLEGRRVEAQEFLQAVGIAQKPAP